MRIKNIGQCVIASIELGEFNSSDNPYYLIDTLQIVYQWVFDKKLLENYYLVLILADSDNKTFWYN